MQKVNRIIVYLRNISYAMLSIVYIMIITFLEMQLYSHSEFQNFFGRRGACSQIPLINPIRHGGGHDGPQNVFDYSALMLRKRKLKLGDF